MSTDFEGTWYNQHGSEMILKVKDGAIAGTYATKVGTPGDEEQFALCGFVSGDLLSFTVNFGKYGSLTSWVGQLAGEDTNSRRIDTMWHLTQNIKDPDEPEQLWASVLSGCDVFTRTPPVRYAKTTKGKKKTTSDPYWGPRLQPPSPQGHGNR